jgi:potassium-transporting ATPase KdpC subunit
MKKTMKIIWTEFSVSWKATVLLAVLLCGLYPAAIWMVGRVFFPDRARGSLVVRDGVVIGSSLLAQDFAGPEYFHPRPAAEGTGYKGSASGGSNLGPLSRKLVEDVERRVKAYRIENGLAPGTLVPADAVTASGSGFDPHISPANANLQVRRVAEARGFGEGTIRRLIRQATENRNLGFLGEPRVNVLRLNIALDGLKR